MDVFTASPEVRYRTTSAPILIKGVGVGVGVGVGACVARYVREEWYCAIEIL